MIFDFFKRQNTKRIGFIIVCIIVLFWQKITVVATPDSLQALMPLNNLIYTITNTNIFLSIITKFSLLLTCAFCFMVMLSPHNILPHRKDLALLLFMSIISVFTSSQNLVNVLLSLILQMLAYHQILSTYRSEKPKTLIFIAAFLAGLSILLSFLYAGTIVYLLIGILILTEIKLRNIFIVILGFIAPFVFMLYFYQLAYHDLGLLFNSIGDIFNNLIFGISDFDDFRLFFACFIILISTISILGIFNHKYAKQIHKKANLLFYIIFLISAIIAAFVPGMKFSSFSFLGISCAFLITRYSQLAKHKFVVEFIIFAIFIAAAIYNNMWF
jgi:hypothetical protein